MVLHAQKNIIGAVANPVTYQTRKKYIPHLPTIQALCELNYAHILRILPDCDTEDLSYLFSVGKPLRYEIHITDTARYTTTLTVKQVADDMPAYLTPSMTVRLYHDARMAG